METRILKRIRQRAKIAIYAKNVGEYKKGEIREGYYKVYSRNCLIEEGDSEDIFWRSWEIMQTYLTKKEKDILIDRRIERKNRVFKRVY